MNVKLCLIFLMVTFFLGCSAPEEEQIVEPEKEAAITMSTEPLSGTIDGRPISGFKATFEKGGFLKLYTGKDPSFDYGDRLMIFTQLESIASVEKKIDTDTGFDSWNIMFDSSDSDQNHSVTQNYQLRLKTGAEKDYRVPASIRIVAVGDFNLDLSGVVDIATSGLVSKNGVVDVSHDHTDTIAYVAQQFVRKKRPNSQVTFGNPIVLNMMGELNEKAKSRGDKRSAYYSAIYHLGERSKGIAKIQLEKRDSGWAVTKLLPADQINVAHPINEPRRDRVTSIFYTVAAAKFEQEIYQPQGGWKRIKEPSYISCGGGQKEGTLGYCQVNFGRYQDKDMSGVECKSVTYLFERQNNQWSIADVLPHEKKYNHRSGQIEDRDLASPTMC